MTIPKMSNPRERFANLVLAAALCGLLAACASPRRTPAPVEDRSSGRSAGSP